MPLEKTYEELLASKINPRNYSSVLPIIYNLRKRESKDYFPQAPNKIIYLNGVVGDGASATFDVLSSPSYTRSQTISLSGTATYIMTGGATPITKPAINLVAQIDMNIQNADRNLIPRQVTEFTINSSGAFSIIIPVSITSLLSIGAHYVYIDAASPDNPPVRLTFAGANEDPTSKFYRTRSFTITG